MAGIFVSYRREDAKAAAGRLADDLREHFQTATIFRDVDTIHAGTDFVQAIKHAIASSQVMLVIIGNDWLAPKGGRNRLLDDRDPVRWEITWAFQHRLRVIPVLLDGAPMVSLEVLPRELYALTQIQAHQQSDARWHYDVKQLAALITTLTGLAPSRASPVPVVAPPRPKRGGWPTALLVMFGGALLVAFCSAVLNQQPGVAAPATAEAAQTTPVLVPAPAPAPAPAAPLDITGVWYGTNRVVPFQFQQAGSAVSVRANIGAEQPVAIVGHGQWSAGLLTLNVNMLTAPGDQPVGSGVMTLTPSADQLHLVGVLQFNGVAATDVDLTR